MSENEEDRGVRLNNPGCIRRSKREATWNGEVWPGKDPDFCTFETPEAGIRAIAITLRSYIRTDGCRTLAQIINRWAPPRENNTDGYLRLVQKRLGVPTWTMIQPDNVVMLRALVEAIIVEECHAYIYPADTVDAGLRAAGLDVASAAPAPSKGTVGAHVAAVAALFALLSVASGCTQQRPQVLDDRPYCVTSPDGLEHCGYFLPIDPAWHDCVPLQFRMQDPRAPICRGIVP